MPDDDETMVLARLSRLLGRGAAPPWRPASGPATPRAGLTTGDDGDPRHPTPDPVGRVLNGGSTATGDAAGSSPRPPSRLTEAVPSRLGGPGAFDPGRRGVKALAVVAAVVVLGAAGWAWHARPHTEPVAAVDSPESPAPPPAAPANPTANAAELVVAVAGKVRRPGLVRLPAGARVADALDAAGGALPGVDVALLNLARKVSDGELLLVGVSTPPEVAGQPAGGAGPAAGAAGAAGGKVNLNTATLAQLDALPGVGPVLAQRILDHRVQHGAFRSIGDLRQVQGIGDARYEDLKDLVTV